MTCACTPCTLERIENATQLTAGGGLPTANAAGFLFASAETLAGHAQRAGHDGATEKFDQDHGERN